MSYWSCTFFFFGPNTQLWIRYIFTTIYWKACLTRCLLSTSTQPIYTSSPSMRIHSPVGNPCVGSSELGTIRQVKKETHGYLLLKWHKSLPLRDVDETWKNTYAMGFRPLPHLPLVSFLRDVELVEWPLRGARVDFGFGFVCTTSVIHSAKEIVVLMYILYLERHEVEILHRTNSFYSRYTFHFIKLPQHYQEISYIWGRFSISFLCRKYKNLSLCKKST